jgi:hypothetical protein
LHPIAGGIRAARGRGLSQFAWMRRSRVLPYNGPMNKDRKQFSLRTLAIAVSLLCVAFGLIAAFPELAGALIYPALYVLGIFIMVTVIVGVLVLGRFLIKKISN